MLVRDVMTLTPYTIRPESDYLAAIAIMRAGKFRHLPVVDESGALVGLVSLADLKHVQPGRLSQQAVIGNGVLVHVHEVMERDVVTIPPDYPIEDAAALMLEHQIDGIIVVEDGKVVGILTHNDLFRQFASILGGGSATVRVTLEVDNKVGQFAALALRIAEAGGSIQSIATYPAADPSRIGFIIRLESLSPEALLNALEDHPGIEILHLLDATDTSAG
jgi:acetoin utilization protein AcuB